jgi:hypothetical protein
MPDDMWANAISYVLAKTINFCFENSESQPTEGRVSTWKLLAADVASWEEYRPATFDPFSEAPKAGNVFPSIWLVRPWHGTATYPFCRYFHRVN